MTHFVVNSSIPTEVADCHSFSHRRYRMKDVSLEIYLIIALGTLLCYSMFLAHRKVKRLIVSWNLFTEKYAENAFFQSFHFLSFDSEKCSAISSGILFCCIEMYNTVIDVQIIAPVIFLVQWKRISTGFCLKRMLVTIVLLVVVASSYEMSGWFLFWGIIIWIERLIKVT